MEEQKKTPEGEESSVGESNEARRIRLSGESIGEDIKTDDIKVNKVENFFYHNKIAIILTVFFVTVFAILIVQMVRHSNPDVSIIYGGPEYISARQAQDFRSVMESLGDDYNNDGKTIIQLYDFVFMTKDQIEKVTSEPDENGNKVVVDMNVNKSNSDRFSSEIFGVDASLCILSKSQYDMVKENGGFVQLSDIFDEIPEGAVDEFGILFYSTKLCRFYNAVRIFPEDSVIALRKISTAGAVMGMSEQAKKNHEYGEKLFKKIMAFEYPEGYEPE